MQAEPQVRDRYEIPAREVPDSANVGSADDEPAVGRFAGCNLVFDGSWGFARKASLHPRAGSPAEHLGWGARLYALAALRGLRQIEY